MPEAMTEAAGAHSHCNCNHQHGQKPEEAHGHQPSHGHSHKHAHPQGHSHEHQHHHGHSHNNTHTHNHDRSQHQHVKVETEIKEAHRGQQGGSASVVEDIKIDMRDTRTDMTVHGSHGHSHKHSHGHSHDHGNDNPHPQGQAIQYKEAAPQFGVADHVDEIIHTEFRYVSGFKPFQFNAPGSCLDPLNPKEKS
ncbi:hypothetical protein EV175_006793 [Coemansia sp. RSA 1933]|nr:hypothetical protein EV175_006793 [Coemansia sp. RSA 1933]